MTKSYQVAKKVLRIAGAASFIGLTMGSTVWAQVPDQLQAGANDAMPSGAGTSLTVIFKNIINTIIYIIGAVAVVMLIVGGVRYVTAAGNPDRVKGATNTILYAIIGIVVAVIAFAAVNFVISRLSGGTGQ